jgi:phage gp29-like protein
MKPQTPEIRASQMIRTVQRVNAWRDSNNPLRSLTMPRAVQWLEDAQRGIFADLQWAYETGIEPGNADLVCIRERDEASIRDCEWIVKQIDPDTRGFDQVLADEQEAFLRELYEGIENLNDACAFLASYRFRGFAHLNPWEREDDPTYIRKLHLLDQWNLTRDGYRGAWKWNPEARQVAFASLPAANLLAPEEYICLETRRPVNRIALVGHVRATTAEKDWDSYVEIYGIPGVFVIMPENVADDKVAAYLELAEGAAEQASGALPGGSQVVTTQEARSSQPFQPRLEWIQKQVVLAGTGGLLTMLAESGSGTLAGSVHADAFRQIARGVARRISQAFQAQIDKPRLARKFPGRPVQAYFDLTAPEYRDTAKAVQNIVALAAQGYRMPAEAVVELTGMEVEDVGQPAPAPLALARSRHIADLSDPSGLSDQSLPVLEGIKKTFSDLETLARDPATTDAALAAAVEKAAKTFPELLPDLTAAIARPLAMDMAAAVPEGAAEGSVNSSARSQHFDPSQPRDEQGQWTEYNSPGSAPEGDTGKPKKRAAFGSDLVEWDDEEQVARRYEVRDVKDAFRDWKPKRLKEEKSFKGNVAMAAKFDTLHKSNGGHIRTGTKIKWPTGAAPTGPGNGMPVVGGGTRSARSQHFDPSQPRDENGQWTDATDADVSVARSHFETVKKKHDSWKRGQSEGASGNYNPHGEELYKASEKLSDTTFRRDWTPAKTQEKRKKWNELVMAAKPMYPAGITPKGVADLQKQAGFDVTQLKRAVEIHKKAGRIS